MGLFGGSSQTSSTNTNVLSFAPSYMVGSGSISPDNSNRQTTPTSIIPYQRDSGEISSNFDLQARLRAAYTDTGADYSSMTKSTNNPNVDAIQPDVMPNLPSLLSLGGYSISTKTLLWIGGIFAILILLKRKK